MTVWQKAAAAATALFEGPRNFGPPPAPRPAARPLPDPLRGAGRGVHPALAVPPSTQTVERRATVHAGTRERRARSRTDRRKADRRILDLGSPYGTERRSGRDDRQGDRRDGRNRGAGIGLTRDYFSQTEARVTSRETGLMAGELVRFHD